MRQYAIAMMMSNARAVMHDGLGNTHARSASAFRQHARALELAYAMTERNTLLEKPHQ
jgi:hypothetical protein